MVIDISTSRGNDRVNDNNPTDKDQDYRTILVFTLMGFFIIYYMILLFYHYSRRNLFPISERSFKLTFIDGLCSMIFVIIVLISSYITDEQNFLLAPNLKYCGIDTIHYVENMSSQMTIKAFQFLNNFIKFFKVINYLIRTFRLSYVFYFNLEQIKKYDSMVKKSLSQRLNNSQTEINVSQNFMHPHQQQNTQNNTTNNQRYNINQATHTSEFSHNISEFGQFHNNQSHNNNNNNNSNNNNNTNNISNNQRNSLMRRPLEASLAYSEMSLGNDSNSVYVPQSRLAYLLKRENLLILISFFSSLIIAVIFYFIPSASPFIFWNINFEKDTQYTHVYDNVIFMVMNFLLIICILFCLMAVQSIEENYRIKNEIYFMLSIFIIFGNTMQFQCPTLISGTDTFDEERNLIFGLIPYRLFISAILDFVAINIEILLPILWSGKERPWFNQQIIQDDLTFFCIKYKNFFDYLYFQSRQKPSQIITAQSCLPEILNLFLEMKSQDTHEQKLQQVLKNFEKFPYLVQAFQSENVNVEEIFVIENEEVKDIRENIQITSLPYQLLYQKTLQILLKYQRMFLKTQQYEQLHKRYQILNQISLTLQEFKMTGEDSN